MEGILTNIIRMAAALCCTLALAACFPPVTTHPVGKVDAQPDSDLVGLWKATMADADKGEDQAYFHFIRKGDGTLTVVIVSAKTKGDGDLMGARVTTAQIDGAKFLNASLLPMDREDKDADLQPSGTVPLLYKRDGSHHLTLYMMDEDATKAAIKAGKIKGTVEPGQFGDATITADQPQLDAFMGSQAGLALFSDKFATMTRMD